MGDIVGVEEMEAVRAVMWKEGQHLKEELVF